MISAVVYQPDWRCFVYALDDGLIVAINDDDKRETFHQTVGQKVETMEAIDSWLVVISKENSWLLGYDQSAGEAIDWWRRNDMVRLIDGSEVNQRLL